jgi:DNA-binding transcriptional ArsR family regulator
VLFAGVARGRESVAAAWQEERPVAALLALDWSAAALTLSALAHPMRLEVVRHLLDGARTAGQLATIPGLGTSGQLYHHLKELQRAGLVVQPRRNEYVVPPERTVQCLVVVAAAASQAPRGTVVDDGARGVAP